MVLFILSSLSSLQASWEISSHHGNRCCRSHFKPTMFCPQTLTILSDNEKGILHLRELELYNIEVKGWTDFLHQKISKLWSAMGPIHALIYIFFKVVYCYIFCKFCNYANVISTCLLQNPALQKHVTKTPRWYCILYNTWRSPLTFPFISTSVAQPMYGM